MLSGRMGHVLTSQPFTSIWKLPLEKNKCAHCQLYDMQEEVTA